MAEAVLAAAGALRLPWGAWHGDAQHQLIVPASWQIEELRMTGGSALTDAAVAHALDTPIGALPLSQLAAGARSAAIAIDDLTRPTRTAALLRQVTDRLTGAGLPDAAIAIVIASGAHRPPTPRDLELKVGAELLRRLRVVPHDPEGDLAETGVTLAGVSVRVNRAFVDADLRIGIGSVMPHPFAGFSGGGKIVIPGLADLDVLARTHKYALMGFRGGAGLEGNRFREDMEAAVRAIGLHWTVNVVVNEARDTAFVAAGDLVGAHRVAADAARRIGATPGSSTPLDALLLNAFPKDAELLQAEGALVALRSGAMGWLKPGAPVVLTAACPEGLGTHRLLGPGGRLFRIPAMKRFLGDHPLWVFAPDVDEHAARSVFWNGYPYFARWGALTSALDRVLPRTPRVGVMPCAPLQVAA